MSKQSEYDKSPFDHGYRSLSVLPEDGAPLTQGYSLAYWQERRLGWEFLMNLYREVGEERKSA